MNKTAAYIQLEEGFLKEAEEQGCDVDFLRGYLKQADDIVEIWKTAFDELAEKSGDPQYKIKLANEIVMFNLTYPDMIEKLAYGYEDFLKDTTQHLNLKPIQQWAQNAGLGTTITNALRQNPNLLANLMATGAGGGLIGLILGSLAGHPGTGLMLGGLGGAGFGALGGQKYLEQLWGGKAEQPETQPPPAAHANTVNINPSTPPASAAPLINTNSTQPHNTGLTQSNPVKLT